MARRFNRDRTTSFARFVWQRFVDDKCFETAGALSYTTLVSLVPLTVAIFAMFSVFPVFASARLTLESFVFSNFVPSATVVLQKTITGFADNASKLTGISILVMLFSALSMMISIEDRLNRIWRVTERRGWGSRVLLYWAALTLGPILVASGILMASYVTAAPFLQGAMGQLGGIGGAFLATLPFVVTFLTLWLMYWGVPNRRISARNAAIGALLGAALFEVGRWGFGQFVSHANNYQLIYGKLAIIPIFLLWIFVSWVIVILAASIAASISAFEYHAPADRLPEGAEFLGLLVVLGHFIHAQRHGGCVDAASIRAREPYLRTPELDGYFDDLLRADLIQRGDVGGWLLTRSLDSTDLLRVYRNTHYRLPLNPAEEAQALGMALPTALGLMLDELADALRQRLGVRLNQVYPLDADDEAAEPEESPA